MINSTFKNCYANCTNGGGFCYNLDKLGKEVDCDVSITGCTFDHLVPSNGKVGMLNFFKSITISNCTIKSMPKAEYLLAIECVSEQEQIIFDKIIFIENQTNTSKNGSECSLGLFISKAQRCIFQDCQFIRNTNIKEVNCSTIICGDATSNNNVQYEFVGCYFEDNKIDKDFNGGALYINAQYEPVQIDSCVFSNAASDVSERGGAIYTSSGTEQEIIINNSHFINMKVSTSDSDSGNAIYIDSTSSKVHVEGCQFNDCGNKGCAISSHGHNVIIENTVIAFKDTSPITSCQGIVIKNKSHFELINTSISNCISSFGGGAFSYLLNGSNYEDNDELVLIENCHFKLNKAVQNVGAVAIESFGFIRIINSTFEENIANYKNIASSNLLAQYTSTHILIHR